MSDGVMYVEILPSTKGIGRAVEKGVGGQLKGVEKSSDSFLSRVGKGVKRVGLGVAALAGTVAAIAVKGGITRALNIEDAQAKLKGLGHDTKSVETIMENALAAVKGTAFGLDAAATTAASAVAAGIKPGQQLERYLRLTADAATIAGVSMEEMGSIINKVTAKGVVQMEDMNRLTDRGVPILQMLAKEYGVSAEEMSKMVSRGEVDAARFRKALEDNVGGAALESGNTTRGAFKNMMAALSRLGLVFVEDGLGGAKTFFNEVTVILDGLADRFRPVVARIRDAFGEAFDPTGIGDKFLSGFDRMVEAIQSGPIPQLLQALQPVLPVLSQVAVLVGGALGKAFKEVAEALAPQLPEIAQALADAVVELAPALADLLVALLPIIPPLAELISAVAPLAAALVELLVPAISGAIEKLKPFIQWTAVVYDLIGGGDFTAAMVSFASIFPNVAATITQFGDRVRAIFESVVSTVMGFVINVQNAMETARTAVVLAWTAIVTAISSKVEQAVSFVRQLPSKVMSAVAALPSLLTGVGKQMIQGLINGVKSMVTRAVQAVKDVGGQMLDGVKSFLGIKSPSRVFRDEVGKMVGLGLLEGVDDRSIRGRIESSVSHMVSVPNVAPVGAASVVQNNEIHVADRDPRVLWRQLGRELQGVMA